MFFKPTSENKFQMNNIAMYTTQSIFFFKRAFILAFITAIILSCITANKKPDIRTALDLAGNNKHELEKVLAHYKQDGKDSLKYRAAFFLISNITMHGTNEENKFSPLITKSILYADSEYNKLFKDKYYDEINTRIPENKKRIRKIATAITNDFKNNRKRKKHTVSSKDINTLNADFLIANIDRAFDSWENSSPSQNLTFLQFCEYLLPYRTKNEVLFWQRDSIQSFFMKYLKQEPTYNYLNAVKWQNLYFKKMRRLLGHQKHTSEKQKIVFP